MGVGPQRINDAPEHRLDANAIGREARVAAKVDAARAKAQPIADGIVDAAAELARVAAVELLAAEAVV